jgi:Tfp pilus assembly protein PilF
MPWSARQKARAEGAGSFCVAALRTISPSEFVRRLKHGIVSHDSKVVWFLGAGCSVSSGVEDAGALTHRWLKELKYLETGDEDDLEDWAESRFPTYDRADPAAAYIQVHEALFYTDQDQQREQESLASDGQPGFGYATLAQLLTHEKWGDRCNTVITTNFDDLAADALYFYSQRKPQVLTHESFDRHVQISDARPTIVKLYGDAHLSSEYLDGNRRLLRTDVKNRLRALATECTLVFVGYGGRDDCILDLFEDMPQGAPSGGVFWVNDKAPGKSMAEWLEGRRAIWAQNDSFDDLMFLLRQEFQLGHPRIDRFDQILQKYEQQYGALAAKKAAPKPAEADSAKAAPAAAAIAAEAAEPKIEASRPAPMVDPAPLQPAKTETPEPTIARPATAQEKPEPEIEVLEPATPDSLAGEPLIAAAVAMKARKQMEQAKKSEQDATAIEPVIATAIESDLDNSDDDEDDVPLAATHKYDEVAASVLRAAAAIPTAASKATAAPTPQDHNGTAATANALADVVDAAKGDGSGEDEDVLELSTEASDSDEGRHKIDALVAAAVKAMATDSEAQNGDQPIDMTVSTAETITAPLGGLDFTAEDVAPPLDALTPQALPDRPRAAPTRSPDAELIDVVDGPGAGGPLFPPSRLMRREDAVVLDARFRSALADNPRDAMLLAQYAQFLTVGRQDHDGAEHYFNRAIDADPQNDAALRLFARFLSDVRRDHERAEDCYRLAIRANFESAETMCSYAEFLWHERGDFETAGECFQVAVDAAPRDAGSLMRYATFLRQVQRNDDAAYALLKLAAASAGTNLAPTVALAEFTAARRSDIEKAETVLAKAMEMDGDDVDTLTAAAQFYAKYKGDLTRAESLFDHALDADPASTDALLAYAEFLHARRADPERAETMIRRAMDLDPGSASIAATYARFRDEVSQDDEGAEDMFRKAINLDPRDATVLTHYGRFLQNSRRKPNAAEDRLRKAVSMDPRNPLALRSYGWFLVLERNNKEEGERYLRRAVSAAPSDPEALSDLAEFLSKYATKREETEEMFRRALSSDEGNKRTLRRYARFMAETKGDAEAADEIYKKVLEDQPKDARALGGSAHSMFLQGRRQEGMNLLNKAFDAAMGDEPKRRSIDLLLELWFYRYCFDESAKRDAIKAAIWLVKEGAKVTRIDLKPLVGRAIADHHSDPDIVRELMHVVSGSAAPERLDRFNVA